MILLKTKFSLLLFSILEKDINNIKLSLYVFARTSILLLSLGVFKNSSLKNSLIHTCNFYIYLYKSHQKRSYTV
ncbi:hypothetical protein CW304_17635 [Bacillus sp. UFRGS-B20]|nr:hypothetical protein CW304_17635 [Bacillus sp. UFRGS-B20]